MAMVKKSFTVTDKQNDWIKTQISSGDYGNESEVVRDLIRREQERNSLRNIRAALIEGEESGISSAKPNEIKKLTLKRLKKSGKI